MLPWIFLTLAIILCDQLAKLFVVGNIGITDFIHVIPGFDFVFVKNTGAAFSILSGRIELLSLISLVFCAALIFYVVKHKPSGRLILTALSLLLAGAVGNVIDRIFRGYVVDFIETTFIKFPVFNIADIAITVGAALLIIYILITPEKKEDKTAE